jgi:hypothetical protein
MCAMVRDGVPCCTRPGRGACERACVRASAHAHWRDTTVDLSTGPILQAPHVLRTCMPPKEASSPGRAHPVEVVVGGGELALAVGACRVQCKHARQHVAGSMRARPARSLNRLARPPLFRPTHPKMSKICGLRYAPGVAFQYDPWQACCSSRYTGGATRPMPYANSNCPSPSASSSATPFPTR